MQVHVLRLWKKNNNALLLNKKSAFRTGDEKKQL